MIFLEKKRQMITIKHSCNIGDLIASLAGLRQYWHDTGNKFVYHQQLNVDAFYFNNSYHPTQESGKQVMCNKKMFDMIKPLLLSQPYIEDFVEYSGQKIVVDLDVIRNGIFVNMPFGSLQSWYAFAYPDLYADISKKWVHLPNVFNAYDEYRGKIVINFTCRYRNDFIQYFFLKEYKDNLLFAGTELEHKEFCTKWNLDIPLLQVNDFLDLAQVLNVAKFVLGNQSFVWNLATALGVPRILEVFAQAPNCTPFVGEHNYGFYHQKGLEYYFNKLNK